jgi:hemerythrin
MADKCDGMVAIAWNEAYTVHVESIDQQHKKIMCRINDLNRTIENGEDEQQIVQTLMKLLEYAQSHFEYEESFMEQYGYPFLQAHRLEHCEFLNTIDRMHPKSGGIPIQSRRRMLSYLVNWLTNHIIREDKQYIAFMLAHGVK